jgi:molybdate transport system ATP-binding protein
LLCDEPVSALDLGSRYALVERLRVVQRTEGIPILYVTHSPAEAVALGSRLFQLREGRVVDQGDPLDVLARSALRPTGALEGVRNVFSAVVEARVDGELRLRLAEDGPSLLVSDDGRAPGSPVLVEVRADDILLARGPIEGVSARNLIGGRVERVVPHAAEAEVVIRTGSITWIVSVVARAVAALELQPGADVRMIIKARSCRVWVPS